MRFLPLLAVDTALLDELSWTTPCWKKVYTTSLRNTTELEGYIAEIELSVFGWTSGRHWYDLALGCIANRHLLQVMSPS